MRGKLSELHCNVSLVSSKNTIDSQLLKYKNLIGYWVSEVSKYVKHSTLPLTNHNKNILFLTRNGLIWPNSGAMGFVFCLKIITECIFYTVQWDLYLVLKL